MRERSCEQVRDALPDHFAGLLPPDETAAVEAHLDVCGECRDEAEFVRFLRGLRPEAPAALAGRMREAARGVRPAGRPAPRWPLLAATAALVVGLGVGVLWLRGDEEGSQGAGAWDVLLPARDWPTGDGMIAGEAVFGDLPDEALVALLEEMSE